MKLPVDPEALSRTEEASYRDFRDLMQQVPVSDKAREELYARMTDPSRFYHTVGHLALLWHRHLEFCREAGFDTPSAHRLVACAIAYHDAVYEGGRIDNEARSAEVWMAASVGCAITQADRHWVAETILATADHLAYPDEDASLDTWRYRIRLWVVDLDLTPLGESPECFDANALALRREVPHLSDEAWEVSTAAFLRRFAEAPRIFRSHALAARFEQAARYNLTKR